MTARRVGKPAGKPVRFTFDGRSYEGIEGEPLAVSLLAADRLVLSRSFRFHRPRGLMCSTGQCGWCECEIDGVPSVRSCRVPVREGMVARGEHAFPSVERDVLSLVGSFSRWIPPTFYHHRFLRPRRLRKPYLDVLRFMGGRGRLRVRAREPLPGRSRRLVSTDVLVVGAGHAGVLAAIGAAEAGARVVAIDSEPETDALPSLAARAVAAGVEIMTGITATGWYDGIVNAVGRDAHFEFRAAAVIAATGSYERVPLVPGADRPGVMAARTVIAAIGHGVLPGQRALLVGDGAELVAAGEALRAAGSEVVGAPIPTSALVSVRGDRRASGAVIRDGSGRRRESVDLVVFGDRTPNLDLVLAAGAAVHPRESTLEPVSDGSGRTTVPSLFVVGRSRHEDHAVWTGRAAARQAAGDVLEDPPAEPRRPGSPAARPARDALVCFCEDVRAWEIRAEQRRGYDDPELIKRRTGALTGPCQGKYCLQAFAALGGTSVPTARPPLRPIRLGDLVAGDPAVEVHRA